MTTPLFHNAGWLGAAALVSLLATPGSGAAPRIASTSPLGVQRGVPIELALSGSDLGGNPRLVAPFAFKVMRPAPGDSSPGSFRTRILADPSTPLGVYPVRIQTDEGLSNPLLLAVGQLPQVAEQEDNSTFEKAQVVQVPAVIEGQVAGNDVDFFRFHGKKGQRIVVDARCARIGSGVDPSIRLSRADRTFVASADDSPGLLTDARLFAVLPADTDYVVELSDSRYQGGGRPVYRLLVGEVPAAEELFPLGGRPAETIGLELRGGTLEQLGLAVSRLVPMPGLGEVHVRGTTASGLDVESLPTLAVCDLPSLREPADPKAPPLRAAVPVALDGRIDPAGDEDRFVLAVKPGQKLRVEVHAADLGSALDGTLRVLDAQGAVIASGDDTTTPTTTNQPPLVSPDPSLEFTAPAGQTELTLALKDLEGRGGVGYPYRIMVSPVVPGFEVTLDDAELAIPKGGAAAVGVKVVRKGYNGPITLNVADPPPGITVRPGTIGEGQTAGAFTLAAAGAANLAPRPLDVVGIGQGGIFAHGTATLVLAQQGPLATNTLVQPGLMAALATATPVTLDAPPGPLDVAHGQVATIKVTASRSPGAEGTLAIAPLAVPAGLAVPAATLGAKGTEVAVAVNVRPDAPLGLASVVLVGKGRVAGADRVLVVPVVALRVVRPAAIEVAAASIAVRPGATAEVKGQVVRKGGFGGAVTVKATGLPAGVKAEPVVVPAGSSAFALRLAADAKAAPASSTGSLALSLQIDRKDYPAAIVTPLTIKVLPR